MTESLEAALWLDACESYVDAVPKSFSRSIGDRSRSFDTTASDEDDSYTNVDDPSTLLSNVPNHCKGKIFEP
ncbi:hypothetical protein TNCV_2185091 [Trichonephila clavipes]|nr:hypothetical protein TNCV_2185091 [Trichonephila clavipes]